MHEIVGIGASVYDTMMNVPKFPKEDTKLAAFRLWHQGGGPCATALAAASLLGVRTAYLGTLGDDTAGVFLKADLEKYGVDTSLLAIKKGYQSGQSFILLNEETGSRTCIWQKGDLPAFRPDEEQLQAVKTAGILHLDGNHLEAALICARAARQAGVRVSMDAGGNYPGVEALLPYVDIFIPSEEFALAFTGEADAEQAAERLYREFRPSVLVVTQGSRGGFLYDGKVRRYPAFPVQAADTNGAGDVFHGAFLAVYLEGKDVWEAAVFASATSALKCSRLGGRAGIPGKEEVKRFLAARRAEEAATSAGDKAAPPAGDKAATSAGDEAATSAGDKAAAGSREEQGGAWGDGPQRTEGRGERE